MCYDCACLSPYHQLHDLDSSPGQIRAVPRRQELGVIAALERGTRFCVAARGGGWEEIELGRGDVLFFEGDLVHGGAAYPHACNTRIHVYLDVPEIKRPRDATWLVPSFVGECVAKWSSMLKKLEI